MNFDLFVVKDVVRGEFGAPMIAQNEATAIRDFRMLCSKSPFAKDLQLYFVGGYSVKTGVIVPSDPRFIIDYSALSEVNESED